MTKALQVVLFGASKAGEFFLSQNPNLNITAFIDNDPSRHGQKLSGIAVLPPDELLSLDYDQIVITSQWVDAISAQLQQLGVPAEKIVVPAKQQVKATLPFLHSATLEMAHVLLLRLNQFLQQHGIRPCLDSGTLLGVTRQQALIPWDDDIDLAIDQSEFSTLLEVIPDFIPQLPHQNLLNWQVLVLNVNDEDCCVNIEFTPKPGADFVPFDISLQLRREQAGYSELVSSAGLFFAPAHHFTQFQQKEFLGQLFYVPTDTDGFLTFMYGDWQEPKKGTKITEYNNRRAQLSHDHCQPRVKKRLLGEPSQ